MHPTTSGSHCRQPSSGSASQEPSPHLGWEQRAGDVSDRGLAQSLPADARGGGEMLVGARAGADKA